MILDLFVRCAFASVVVVAWNCVLWVNYLFCNVLPLLGLLCDKPGTCEGTALGFFLGCVVVLPPVVLFFAGVVTELQLCYAMYLILTSQSERLGSDLGKISKKAFLVIIGFDLFFVGGLALLFVFA